MGYYKIMKSLMVAEVRKHFSDILVQVQNGEKVKIVYGKSKKPIAMLVPLEDVTLPRKIGILNGKASFKTKGNGKITEEAFLGL
jgi:antitoxin (DNA-binding transcriptional repressor) of toxin-antitoxin stability system